MIKHEIFISKRIVCKLILILIFFTSFNAVSQSTNKVYFHRNFSKRVDTNKISLRKYIRIYEKNDSLSTLVTDYIQWGLRENLRKKIREGIYVGFKNNYEIDSFYNHYRLLGYNLNIDFKGKYASIKGYTPKGDVASEKLHKNNIIKYIQVYHRETNEPILISGNGVEIVDNVKRNELTKVIYRDSLKVESYTIRRSRNDTIFHKLDTKASPKNGMRSFYKDIVSKLEFPRKALRAGVEKEVTIKFVVNEKGKLVDFEMISKKNDYFNFEDHTVKVLKKLPKWIPGTINGKPVKTSFKLPVTFAILR